MSDTNDIVNSFITSTDHWVYGFTQIDNGIIDHPELDIYDKMVHIAIKRMINQQDKITFPSYETIGKIAGCSRRKAIDTVKHLMDVDLIAKLGEHQQYGTNVYIIKRIQESKVLGDPEKNAQYAMDKMGIKKKEPADPPPAKKEDHIPYKEILDHLNNQAGTKFSHTGQTNQKLIKARYNEMKKTGLDHQVIIWEFKNVIDIKTEQWKDTDFAQYLRPSTLFGNKFDQYRNESPNRKAPGQSGQAQDDWKTKFLEEGDE